MCVWGGGGGGCKTSIENKIKCTTDTAFNDKGSERFIIYVRFFFLLKIHSCACHFMKTKYRVSMPSQVIS